VFFKLFFEAEAFAAILIAHRTHGRSLKFVYGGGGSWNSRARERFLERRQHARGSGECCKLCQRCLGLCPTAFDAV